MGADGVKVVAEKIGSQPANRLVHEDLGYALFAKVANALCARISRRISSFPRPGSDALNRRNDFLQYLPCFLDMLCPSYHGWLAA